MSNGANNVIKQERVDALAKALKDLYNDLVQKAPDRHPWETPECLPLPRFLPSVRKQWTEEEKQHARNCRYCQRMLAISWRGGEHPALDELRQYRARTYPYPQAIEYHLERDACWRCRAVLQLLQLPESIAAAVRLQREQAFLGLSSTAVEELAAWHQAMVKRAVAWMLQGPALEAHAAAFAGQRPPFYQRFDLEVPFARGSEGEAEASKWPITITFRQTDPPEEELLVHVEAKGLPEGVTSARVTIYGEDVREVVVPFEPFGRAGGWIGTASLGKFREVVRELGSGAEWVVAVELEEAVELPEDLSNVLEADSLEGKE